MPTSTGLRLTRALRHRNFLFLSRRSPVLVDRMDRRRMLVLTQAASLLQSAALANTLGILMASAGVGAIAERVGAPLTP